MDSKDSELFKQLNHLDKLTFQTKGLLASLMELNTPQQGALWLAFDCMTELESCINSLSAKLMKTLPESADEQ